ncbi:hypothetical protein ACH5RR_024716 [Cinchona calisaya]|uniref:RING-type domain-containing protein n=1 Tax=Cinchona calisaya TaxID=153742 RepID=A0ABD2YYN4_9GENT
MGFGKPNDEHKLPVPLHGHSEFCFPSRESGASDCGQMSLGVNSFDADFVSFPYMSLPNSPWENMQASHQSYPHDPQTGNHLMTGLMRLNTLQSSQVDPSLSNLRGSLRNGDVCSSGFQNNQINLNFIPTGSKAAGGYQMNGQGREAALSNMNWSQIRDTSLNLGCGTSMSHHNTNFLELTLGIGGTADSRTKTNFDPREIASRLAETVGPHISSSQIQPATNPYHNLTVNYSNFQSNPDSFPGSVSKLDGLGGWTSSHNGDGTKQGATIAMSSNAYLNPHMPEAFNEHNFFENNAKNTGFMDKSIGRPSAQESYKCSQGNPSSSSLPFNSSYLCLPHPGFTKQSDLASETCEPTWISTQPTRDQLWNSYSMNPGDATSSFNSHSSRHSRSSVAQDYLGISMLPLQSSAIEAVESGPQSISFWPDGQLTSVHQVNSSQTFGSGDFPKKTGLQITEGSGKKPATGAPFPRRLGLQIDAAAAQSTSGSVLPMNMGVQTGSNEHQSRNSVPVQQTKDLVRPISGHLQDRLAAQFNYQRPSLSAGQPQHVVSAKIPKNLARVDHPTGQVLANPRVGRPSHAYGDIGQPSLKRRANEPPPVPAWGQRRRLVTIHHSAMPAPATLPPSTPASPHIRWAGFDSPPPQPSGQRCMLCKRDLSFTPEGPVYQPSITPAAAVLPCGHTFHDLCLQNITPEDQSKDPPCIPCAIGET